VAGLLDEARAACAAIASDALYVRIDAERIGTYARTLPLVNAPPTLDPVLHYVEPEHDPEGTAAFVLTLDAINFGSGWFPEIVGPTASGYTAVAGRLAARFRERGALPTDRLATLDAAGAAELIGFEAGNAAAAELTGLYARALNDLGILVEEAYGGRFLALVEDAGGSAERLAGILRRMPLFEDPPFYKRAQIAAADLDLAGVARFADLERLTAFADNLLPHVLRHDGVLSYAPDLAARIDRGEPLPAGSREEMEIRAAAVHAVELIAAVTGTPPMRIDHVLWHRGQQPEYRAKPRHRTKTAFY